MSTLIVVDASVALKWVVHEAGSDEASALLADMADGALPLAAPEHLVGSAAPGWGLTTYDALYVLLALDLDAELITADSRLVDAARREALPVRPLTA